MRKICIITGTRAEYGRLQGLMQQIQDDDDLELQIIATAMHLSPEFGLTYREIERDGFHINEKVEMLLSSDTPVGVTKSMGLGIIGFADALERLKPDMVVILGDRYEALGAAEAALLANIPIIHIHGGELTEGAVDNAIRHALTKLAQIHFVSESEYYHRVLQMGEDPRFVFETGALGNDNIVNAKLPTKDELAESLHIHLEKPFFLVTYHPVTIESCATRNPLMELFAALDEFSQYQVIFTKSNSDAGGRLINQQIDRYAQENPERVWAFQSLGQIRYLSAMKYCMAVVGNSSSGILEAPLFHVPTVNIGARQGGRKRYISIIDCQEKKSEIVSAIKKAISDQFRQAIAGCYLPHTDGKVAETMKDIIKNIDLTNICAKRFIDWERK